MAVDFEVYDSPSFDILLCVTYPPPPPHHIFGYTPLQFPSVHQPDMEITPPKMLYSCPCGMVAKNNHQSSMQSCHTLECVCQCTVHILGDPPWVFNVFASVQCIYWVTPPECSVCLPVYSAYTGWPPRVFNVFASVQCIYWVTPLSVQCVCQCTVHILGDPPECSMCLPVYSAYTGWPPRVFNVFASVQCIYWVTPPSVQCVCQCTVHILGDPPECSVCLPVYSAYTGWPPRVFNVFASVQCRYWVTPQSVQLGNASATILSTNKCCHIGSFTSADYSDWCHVYGVFRFFGM